MKNVFLEASTPQGLTEEQIRCALGEALCGGPEPKRVLILPPDITRLHSYAGPITRMLHELLSGTAIDVMPALGAHMPMTAEEIARMYPGVPRQHFLPHDWRRDVREIGAVPAEMIEQLSEGRMREPLPVEVNRRLLDGAYDLILSVGQVVPHEVVGMSNYNKNIFVGCGGSRIIHGSHYLGALYGMERIMGRDRSPVHTVFDYAEQRFAMHIPLVYIMTVTTAQSAGVRVHSLAVGRERSLYSRTIAVSRKHNFTVLEKPLQKVVAYLDPEEFHTTWVGNKAIYRTRMAIADGGSLLVIAPGVQRFGEDTASDEMIRKFGYSGRDVLLEQMGRSHDLAASRGVAAHLIHGSPEGRFTVTYAPGQLSEQEIRSVGFAYLPLRDALAQYDIGSLRPGKNTVNGEEIYFIGNPAMGLWADRARFAGSNRDAEREEGGNPSDAVSNPAL